MCGIAGSSDFEKAYNLYKINLQRGSQSTGLMAVIPGKKLYFIHKKPGIFDEEDCESFKEKFKESKWDYSYFLFHSRAPTNTTDTVWSEETTHPFYENELQNHLRSNKHIFLKDPQASHLRTKSLPGLY